MEIESIAIKGLVVEDMCPTKGRPSKYKWKKFIKESSFLTAQEGGNDICEAQFLPFGTYGIDVPNSNEHKIASLPHLTPQQVVLAKVKSSLTQYLVRHYPLSSTSMNGVSNKSAYKLHGMLYVHGGKEGLLFQVTRRTSSVTMR